jgi:hypothetical protein
MSRHLGIEVEANLASGLENNNEAEGVIENSFKAMAKTHLNLDMSELGLFESARVPLSSTEFKIRVSDLPSSYKKLARKTRDETRRENFRLELFLVPHFKAWINTNQMKNAIAIGGEPPDPSYDEFR